MISNLVYFYRVAHHVRPDVDSRSSVAAAKDIFTVGQGEMQVPNHTRSWKSIVFANLVVQKEKTKRQTIFNYRPTTTPQLRCSRAGFPPRQLFPIKWSLPLIASWLHPDRARQPYCYNDRSEITCNQLNQKAVHKFRQSSDMSFNLFSPCVVSLNTFGTLRPHQRGKELNGDLSL